MAPSKSRPRHSKSARSDRSLNAFAIATSENKDKLAISDQYLGGDSDGEGVDSDGNEWKLGEVGAGDSDIDSDEAMGESDEERFEDFSFRGSTSNDSEKKKLGSVIEDEHDEDTEEEDEGGQYINLSEMLDRKTPEVSDVGENVLKNKKKRTAPESDDEDGMQLLKNSATGEPSDSNDEKDSGDESEAFLGFSDGDDDTPEDPLKLEALQSAILALPTAERSAKRIRLDDANEGKTPGEYNLALSSDSKKLSLTDFLHTVADPNLKKSFKHMPDDGEGKSNSGILGKLSAPLAKRQQDRVERSAAYGQTKETLKKWVDTVKQNREADHLHFPLANGPNAPATGQSKLVPLNPSESRPLNDFEATISGILKESNMASEKQIQGFEEFEANKLSVEEVQKRRAELRMARELMYREEVRAKRLKKIKSKSYHRIKKRERQRQEQAIEAAIVEERGGSDSEEKEHGVRKRAEERMTLKHKQSRWARGIKLSGRGAWDSEARGGAVEMAQRHDELRQRIKGKDIGSNFESDEEQSDSDEYDEGEGERQRILNDIERLEVRDQNTTRESKLMGMKFMQTAEAAKRKDNEALIENLKDHWEAVERDENNADEDEEINSDSVKNNGRFSFNPKTTNKATLKTPKVTAGFEAPLASSDEESGSNENIQLINKASSTTLSQKNPFTTPKYSIGQQGGKHQTFEYNDTSTNPWLPNPNGNITRPKAKALVHGKKEAKGARANYKILKARKATATEDIDVHENVIIDPNATIKLTIQQDSEDEEERDIDDQITLISAQGKKAQEQRELIKRAFAGDNVMQEFRKEKKKTIDDDGDKVIDNTLPGWGHWSGAGLSKRQTMLNQRRKKVVKIVEGIKKDKRKDTKLDRVIINEKRDKKAVKFQSGQVPHPYESKAQYERSMRLPIGPEWATKSTFQDATTPRVMVKQGRVVEPMAAPFK